MKILLIGIPGSGKTTVAKALAEKFGLCMVKTGEILRGMMDQHARGSEIRQALDQGEYVDDSLAAEIVKEEVQSDKCRMGFVMDGYPRRAEQLELYNPGFDVVIYLGISEEEATKRLLARGRADDTPAVIKKRLEVHAKYMSDVLEAFEKTGKLHRVNGEQDIKEVISVCEGVIDEE